LSREIGDKRVSNMSRYRRAYASQRAISGGDAMRPNRLLVLVASIMLLFTLGLLQAKPIPSNKKDELAPAFKPIEIKNVLDQNDPKDEKLNNPSKKYTVKLHKDKTYVIDLISADFDSYLRLLDKKGKQLAEDDDGGGDLNSRIIHSASGTGDYQIVATSLDGQVGKFTLAVRELNIQGEAKARILGKDGLTINDEIGQNDASDLDKLTKVLTIELNAGHSYVFDIEAQDFDGHLYVFDGKSKLLGQDLAKVIHAPATDGVHHLVVKSFDGQLGKFELKVREFTLKGEAKPREIGKDGLKITDQIGNNDTSAIGKLGKVYSVQLKAGQTYTIDLESQTLDSYLYLFDSKSTLLALDDDSGGDLNSRITFRVERDGVFHILATTLDGNDTGEFTLKVRKN
jgi:hypothetical protein